MNIFIIYILLTFSIATSAGVYFRGKWWWGYIDLLTHVGGAIGIFFLFAFATSERRIFELNQDRERYTAQLNSMSSNRPSPNAKPSEEIVESSISLLSTIPELFEACSYSLSPINTKPSPQCLTAEKIAPPVEQYLKTIELSNFASDELRLAAACKASIKLVRSIEETRISSIISNGLLAHYIEGLKRDFSPFDFEGAEKYVDKFDKKIEETIDALPTFFREDVEYMKLLEMERMAVAQIILPSLNFCLLAPIKELEELSDWDVRKTSLGERVDEAKAEINRLKVDPPENRRILGIHLFVWPYVGVAFFALQFAKVVAMTRPAPRAEAEPITGPDDE